MKTVKEIHKYLKDSLDINRVQVKERYVFV